MPDNIPTPGGALPPKPPEASKVQPKKETVRINLPPKPSAAPTIKLPTLPAGGPSAAPGVGHFPPPPAPPAAGAAPLRTAAAPTASAAPASAQKPAPRAQVPVRPAAISGLDKALAITAAVAAAAAVGSTVYCMLLFKP